MLNPIPKDFKWLMNNYFNFFNKYGLDEPLLQKGYDNWIAKGGTTIGFIGSVFNMILACVEKDTKDKQTLLKSKRDIYLEMAFFQRRHKGDKSHDLMKEVLRIDVINASSSGLKLTASILSTPCCSYCESSNGKRLSLEEALKFEHILNHNCTRYSGCICSYNFHPERDNKGRLIRT